MKSITVVACAVCFVALAPCSYGQRFVTLYNISGDNPIGLAWARNALYGTTFAYGGASFNCGTVFRLRPPATGGDPWVGTVLYSFPDVVGEPCSPTGAPILGPSGTLYGATLGGGAYFFGVLYDLQPPEAPGADWSENDLYTFDTPGTNVGYAVSGLVKGPGASFYVLTSTSTLCRLRPPASPGGAWTAQVLYRFPAVPLDSLVAGPNGVLYGTAHGGGAVFQLTPPASPGGTWTATVLHTFHDKDLVGNPIAVTVAPDGTIYGTAFGWDPPLGNGYSAIFQLTPPSAAGGEWTYTNLTTPTNAEHFNTPVVLVNGNLYGGVSTGTGGSIYELQPPSAPGGAWTMTTLHTFDGQVPSGNLVAGANGTVYGTTAAAPGQPSSGTVFAITTK